MPTEQPTNPTDEPQTPPVEETPTETAPTEPEAPETEPEVKTFDEAYVKQLREEAAANRVKAKKQTEEVEALKAQLQGLTDGLAKLTGAPQETPIEEQLAAVTNERDEAQARINSLLEERAIATIAGEQKVNADLLIPVLKGTGKLNDLNPMAEDYQTQVAEIVKATVEAFPQLRAQTVPSSSGQSPTPTKNAPAPITLDDLNSMSTEEIYEAQKSGRLNHLIK